MIIRILSNNSEITIIALLFKKIIIIIHYFIYEKTSPNFTFTIIILNTINMLYL